MGRWVIQPSPANSLLLMNSAVLWITIWWAFWHAKPFFFLLQKQILWTVLKMKFFRNSQQQMGNQQPPQQQLNDPMSNMGPQGMTMNNQVSSLATYYCTYFFLSILYPKPSWFLLLLEFSILDCAFSFMRKTAGNTGNSNYSIERWDDFYCRCCCPCCSYFPFSLF